MTGTEEGRQNGLMIRRQQTGDTGYLYDDDSGYSPFALERF